MPVTIKDIARRAQVSYTTVSLAFQEDSRISPKRRRQILKIADELGYVPNRQARALKGSGTQTIGILVNDITNPFFALIARAANDAAASRGYEVLIADSRWQSKHELAEIQRMIHARVDGVLACFGHTGAECHRQLEQHNIPCLALDAISADYGGSYVANDIPAAAHLGIGHLIEIGCKKIVFFNADAEIKKFVAFQVLEEEFLSTLRKHGHKPRHDQVVYAGMTIDAGRQAMQALLTRSPDVDGLFCANTLCAMGAMEVAQKAGIKIGRELAVVGIDDIDICDLESISLTAVRQPYQRLTEVATNLLIDCIQDRGLPDLRMALKPELIVRNSTRRKP
jgi:LacI family transcriptional regulator